HASSGSPRAFPCSRHTPTHTHPHTHTHTHTHTHNLWALCFSSLTVIQSSNIPTAITMGTHTHTHTRTHTHTHTTHTHALTDARTHALVISCAHTTGKKISHSF